MMTEISLNILDVAENSTKAGATLVTITVEADFGADQLTVTIEDNGCGMTKEELEQILDQALQDVTGAGGAGHRPFFHKPYHKKSGVGRSFL